MQARENLEKLEHRSAKVAQWRKLVTKQDDDENFFEYTNASLREFGASGPSPAAAASATTGEGASYGMEGGGTYDDEDIYDAVPTWFVGQMKRDECDNMVKAAGPGRFLVRESSSGDKYVISVNHQNKAKSFQILMHTSGAKSVYEFSGKKDHASLEAVVQYSIERGIHKQGVRINLTTSAR
jgi:hypothetical protein